MKRESHRVQVIRKGKRKGRTGYKFAGFHCIHIIKYLSAQTNVGGVLYFEMGLSQRNPIDVFIKPCFCCMFFILLIHNCASSEVLPKFQVMLQNIAIFRKLVPNLSVTSSDIMPLHHIMYNPCMHSMCTYIACLIDVCVHYTVHCINKQTLQIRRFVFRYNDEF